MGLKETLEWAKTEWGIFARRDDMSAGDMLRWLGQWVPFGARTIGWGTVSLVLGPLTKEHGASTWAMKKWSQASLEGLKIQTRSAGEHLVPAGGYIYASNHQSLLDILVLGAVLPGDFKWAAKRSLMKIPFLGWHLALSGHVPVERKAGRRAAAEVIKRFEIVLRDDKILLVFPEGTRSEDGALQPFKNGSFYAAVRADKPVVPVAIDGTHSLMAKHDTDTGEAREVERRQVEIRIGEPLFPKKDGKERERVEDLRDRTHEAVQALLSEIRR